MNEHRLALGAIALAAGLAACRGNAPVTGAGSALPAVAASPASKIDHVVVIVQENRSFDNLFHGFPGADSADYGSAHGRKVSLRRAPLDYPRDINHSHLQFLEDYDGGKNDGFDREIKGFTSTCPTAPQNDPNCWIFFNGFHRRVAYSFVPRPQIEPYWIMASRYALADRAFASTNGPSYTTHQYMIAGRAGHMIENPLPSPNPGPGVNPPWGCDSTANVQTWTLARGTTDPPYYGSRTGVEQRGPFPCFHYATIAQRLDDAGVSWAYYAPEIGIRGDVWSAFDAIWEVRYGADWARNVRSPETRVFDDIAGGKLPAVSWIVPSLVNSDHAGGTLATGPQWVASIVNAVGKSPYWKSTIVIVTWDDWGGWYDHVPPPQLADPETGAYEGLGFRVPLIVISPYAKHGYVSHKRHELASTLVLIEKTFGLSKLGGADERADDLSDMLNFSQPPRSYNFIPASLRAEDFLRQPRSLEPPDD